MIAISQLESGLRIVTETITGARSVCSGVWVGVGARDEPADVAGVSHFLEHLLFKGTDSRSAQDIARSVDRVGGDMNAFTTKEYTAYYTRLPARVGVEALEMLGDVVCRPALRPSDVDSERQVIAEELAMDDDSPDDKVHQVLAEAIFGDHPLGRETAGDRATVASITSEQVRAFFERWYRPANMVLAVAGHVDHDDVVRAASTWKFATAGGERPDRTAPTVNPRALAFVKRPTEQAHLALGHVGFRRADVRRESLDVANHVLGGGMSSRLFDEIRERRGLAYSVYSAPMSFADAGAMTIYAGTAPSNVEVVLDCIDAEVERLLAHGITDDERDVAVGYLTGAYELGLEDASARMSRLGGQLTVHGRLLDIDEQLDRYRAVTAEAAVAALSDVIRSPRSMAVVGPMSERALRRRVA